MPYIHGVDHQEALKSRDVRKQTQPLGPAVHQDHAGRNTWVALQVLDRMNSDAVVGVNQVSKP